MNINSITHKNLSFVDIHHPKETEIKHLRKEYGFSQIHLDDYLSGQQVPKIEPVKKYILTVLDFPYVETGSTNGGGEKRQFHGVTTAITDIITMPLTLPRLLFAHAEKKRIRTGHVNFFLGKDFVVVLHDESTPQIDDIFIKCQRKLSYREKYLANGPFYLFYSIVDSLVDRTFMLMNEVANSIDEIDLHLLQDYPPIRIVEEISTTRRNLVLFKSMLSPAMRIFSELENEKYKDFGEVDIAWWTSLSDHLKKIIYRLQGSSELLEGIGKSHESLLTARTNEIVKVLTMFTAIILPLTFITGLYGMNIAGLPGAENPRILLELALIMAGIAAALGIVFRIRRWF